MLELRQCTEQIIRIGVLLEKQTKLTDPLIPVYGAQLDWYYWRYLIKPDNTILDLSGHSWTDIPNCAGCYFLTLTEEDTAQLGPLVVYIFDAASLGKPIFTEFVVVTQNSWDSKCGCELLNVEPYAQKG